ncbi:MAG: VOC family protein [Candidatus Promineifilaceae bacterium]
MHVVTSYPDGVFNWVDLSTPDTAGAAAFYTALFGWEHEDIPISMGGFYTMLRMDGKNVAGLGSMSPGMEGVPAFWASYVKHSDADAIAARISEGGGTVMMPPMDVMEEGRMLIAQDPTGAMFGVWQPRNHIGAQLVNMPNTLIWNELQTRDAAAAEAFYAHVFGWTAARDDSGYVVFAADGRRQAGMMQMDDSWGPVPPNWAVYFMVDDLEGKVAKAQELGGNVLVPPTSAGEMGRFAVLQDPQGGVFTVMAFSGPVDPPPGA